MLLRNSSRPVLTENWETNGFGVYIHWPYCQAKCPYCDFNSHVVREIDQDAWAGAYVQEIERYGRLTEGRNVRSVYFGGGTPSLMSGHVVEAVLETISRVWTVDSDIEITLEANPTSVEAARFRDYRSAGVNRVSVGVQALNNADLRALGRLHDVDEAMSAIATARDTFDRMSFDLIYARQDQTLDAWRKELEAALGMGPDHLSLYQLTIEDGTAFGDRFRVGKLGGLPDVDLGADMYELTQDMTVTAGLPAYEVSNHAENGHEGRHNLIYWSGGDYVGIGPGAHGRLTVNGERWATDALSSPALWIDGVRRGRRTESKEALTPKERASEYLMMSLRTSIGCDKSMISETYVNTDAVDSLVREGFLEHEASRLRTTAKGRLVLNSVLNALLSTAD